MDKTYALNNITTQLDKNQYSAILCSSSMPASWRLYLARRLMRAQRFPARLKPPLCLHKLFHNFLFLFTTCLDLFSCYPLPWLFKSCTFTPCWGLRDSPCPRRHSPLDGQTSGWYPTILSVQYWYTFKILLFYFILFFLNCCLMLQQCIMHWRWSRMLNC